MMTLRRIIRCVCKYMHKQHAKTHFQKFKKFDDLHYKCHGITKLSSAVAGTYKFVAAHCDVKLCHRLLEMGFIPGEEVMVVKKTGYKSNIVVKIKGSKIALSDKIADRVLLKRK